MCPLRGDFSTGEHHATCFAPICEKYDILSIDMMDGAFVKHYTLLFKIKSFHGT
jgi:pentose-5-phosphate-3-epimerase